MPTICQNLEPVSPRRLWFQPRRHPHSGYYQHADRHCDYGAPYAIGMETTDDSAKENRLYRTRWSGFHVRVPLAVSVIPHDNLTHACLLKHLCDYHPSDRLRRPNQL